MDRNINVIARFRPPRSGEKGDVCYLEPEEDRFKMQFAPQIIKQWTFNKVYYPETTQEQLYNSSVKHMIDMFMQGYNATIFAYGQTGSGKTYTMIGPSGKERDQILSGISPRAMKDIFNYIQDAPSTECFKIRLSFLEIYNERVGDLLNIEKQDLRICMDKKGEINIIDCTEIPVTSAEQMMKIYHQGAKNRRTAETEMNKVSSRSHSILRIKMERNDGSGNLLSSVLNLIDLAGSEKISKSKVEGQGLVEANNINTSLMTLGKVINALAVMAEKGGMNATKSNSKIPSPNSKSTTRNNNNNSFNGKLSGTIHIPYRDSKLTRLLQTSLSGNSLVLVVINLSPDCSDLQENNSSILFGMRASTIKTNPKKNEDFTKEQLIKKLREANAIIRALRQQLKENGIKITPITNMSDILCDNLSLNDDKLQESGIEMTQNILNPNRNIETSDNKNDNDNNMAKSETQIGGTKNITLSDLMTSDAGILSPAEPVSTIILENRNGGGMAEKIASLEQQIKDSDMEILRLKDCVEDYEAEIRELRNEKYNYECWINNQKEQSKSKDAEINNIRNIFEQTKSQMQMEAEKVQSLQCSYDVLKERYEKARAVLMQVKEKLPNMEKKNSPLSTNNPSKDIDKLKLENGELKANIERLQNELKRIRIERDSSYDALKSITEENQRINRNNEAKIAKHEELLQLIAFNPSQVDTFMRGGKKIAEKKNNTL